MIRVLTRGSHKATRAYLSRLMNRDIYAELDAYGRRGVQALAASTPVSTGATARQWNYRIVRDRKRTSIEWYNTNIVNGFPVAIGIQYGHGTGTGGWVAGRDYINPTMQPLFDQITAEFWRTVTSA